MFVAGLKTRASKAGVISPGPNWPSAPPLPTEEQELGCSWAAAGLQLGCSWGQLGWAGLELDQPGWAGLGLGWAGLGRVGPGWAGPGWAGLPLPDEEQVECRRAASPKLISPALICSSSCSAWPRSFTRMCAAEAERLISTSSNAWTGCRLIVVALPGWAGVTGGGDAADSDRCSRRCCR